MINIRDITKPISQKSAKDNSTTESPSKKQYQAY